MSSFKKKLISLLSVIIISISSVRGVVAYADENIVSDSTFSSVIDYDVVDDITTVTEVTSIENTEVTEITSTSLSSSFSYDIVVKNDDIFNSLDSFVDVYAVTMTTDTKQLLLKELRLLCVDVITRSNSYTLESFRTAFIEICLSYNIDITDDFNQSLDEYISKYFEDEFEDNEITIMLNSIYISLSFITILLILKIF